MKKSIEILNNHFETDQPLVECDTVMTDVKSILDAMDEYALYKAENLPISSVVKSEEEDMKNLENLTDHNTNVVSQFMCHCKEEGLEIPDSLFESYFGA